MTNLSELTRKEQVLAVLKEHVGLWVDGTMLANEQVGGSEGLKRVRELRGEGHLIQSRKHPDPGRAIYQYRLVEQEAISGEPATWVPPKKERSVDRVLSYGDTPRRDPAPRPVPPPQTGGGFWDDRVEPEVPWRDWKPAKKSPGTLEYIYWIGKQRVVAAIGDLGDGRWGWGVLVPANKSRMTPERKGGHGVWPDRDAARFAVEECIKQMRASGEYR